MVSSDRPLSPCYEMQVACNLPSTKLSPRSRSRCTPVLKKLLRLSRHIGADVVRYNHKTRLATDSTYAINYLLENSRIKTVFDVGANIGQSALSFRQQFPDANIYTFEPAEEAFNSLQQACCDESKIHPFQLAISDINGDKEFFINEDQSCNSLFESSRELKTQHLHEKLTTVERRTVQCQTLETFCEQHSIEEIDFLKMDIQGAELQAIAGGAELFASGRVKVVFCEVCFSPMYKDACDFSSISDEMKSLGYSLYGLYHLYHFESDGLLWGDAIFINSELLKK